MTALAHAGSLRMEQPLARTRSRASQPSSDKPVMYELVHWISGRIRLRIPRLAYDAKFAQRLSETVMSLPGLKEARISATSASLVVTYRVDPVDTARRGPHAADQAVLPPLLECIRSAADADVIAIATPAPAAARTKLPGDEPINYVDRLGLPALGIALSAGVLAGMAIPGVLVGGVVIASALPIFKRTLQGIREEKRLTVDFLDATAIVLLTAQASFLAPAIVVGIIEGSEILRDWTARRSRRATLDLLLAQDHLVLVERNGQQNHLTLDEIQVGDVILVYAGDRIPVDGFVLEGSALVDEHQMTGSAAPVARGTGDEVHATTVLVEGHLRIHATHTGHETMAAAILSLLHAAPRLDTRVSNYARKVGNGAVLPTLAIAAALWGTTGSVARATSIVSLDLGTGMRVSVPIAILNAQAEAARQGILIRSGRALEMLAQVDVVIFDKTATLTQGKAHVVDVRVVDAHVSAGTILQLAASAEQGLDHPIAAAIVRHAELLGLQSGECTAWNYVAGQGVVATVDGCVVHVGSRTLLAHAGIDVDDTSGGLIDTNRAASQVYVAREGVLLGVILCTDSLRRESASVVAELQAMRKTALITTGDNHAVADAAAVELAVAPEHVYAELLPHQKVELVNALRARGHKVAVVGDGINDAAAMAHADVAVTLGSATDLAQESADIVLLNNDLRDLVAATQLAHHTMDIVEQNKWIVVAPNVAAIVYGTLMVLNPIAGVVINNGTAMVAALNSLRPMRPANGAQQIEHRNN